MRERHTVFLGEGVVVVVVVCFVLFHKFEKGRRQSIRRGEADPLYFPREFLVLFLFIMLRPGTFLS